MIKSLKDGKKMIPLGSGTILLIGVRDEGSNISICNTGESPLDTNDTIILAHAEIDEVVLALLDIKKTVSRKKAA